jgi:ATP-dependent Lon protease
MNVTSDTAASVVVVPVLQVPGVLLPGTLATITLEDGPAQAAVAAALAGDGRLLLVPDIDGRTSSVGVLARVPNSGALPNGAPAAIVQTERRARLVGEVSSERAGRWVSVEPVVEPRATPRVEALGRELRVVIEEIAKLRGSRRLPELLRTVADPGALADGVTAWSDASADHKLGVLEATEPGVRVELVLRWAKDALAELQVSERIRTDVTEGMDRQQREFLLRQQLAAIRKELGDGDDDVVEQYRERFAARTLPSKVRDAVGKELDRMERTSGQSPELGWIRTWLDRVLELPWGTTTNDALDLVTARAVLDADHHGLDDVKDRIVEFLAVRKLRSERGLDSVTGPVGDGDTEHAGDTVPAGDREPAGGRDQRAGTDRRSGAGAILTLVGPPGVGKTSLGESIARAMGRRFVRVALGGVRDEAEIRGHRRTYVGSQPGRIVRAIAEAGSMNPVVLLDEVDKLSAGGWSGDPTAALLEVLDPAQNHTFRDHYLEVELDLSDVVFVATANVADSIPAPLLDRMELVRLDGYTEDDKVVIARDHLVPRQVERSGLRMDEVVLSEEVVRKVIADYTREAGVRSLERELGRALRKVAAKVGSGEPTPVTIDPDVLQPYFGRARFVDEVADRVDVAGVATGLAVTGSGGDVLYIETSASDGEPGLTLTGQLGDVMKESAQIALSYVRSHAGELGIDAARLQRTVHVHVPAGAVPKDGPSAGITITTALVSLLTDRPVNPALGMTGEITLQGKVLPIGGVKQKVLAAHRAGLVEVVLPKRNGPDLEDVPEKVRDVMTFHLADTYDDVLRAAFASS